MGLYIKSLEMPTGRPMWIVVHSDGTVEANELSASRPVGWQTLPNAAVAVPAHGRLIDVDALFEEQARMVPLGITDVNAFLDGLSAAYKAIHAAPTIIPAEEEK